MAKSFHDGFCPVKNAMESNKSKLSAHGLHSQTEFMKGAAKPKAPPAKDATKCCFMKDAIDFLTRH